MTSDMQRKVQLTQLEIMKAVHKICVDNDITYYLCGGSALGAIRHKGFIPWDDDLDIMLPRKDYEVLVQKLREYLPDTYWLQDYSTDENYWQPFAKVRKVGTVYKEVGMESIEDSKSGVWIDIFPLDYVKKKNSINLKLRKSIVRTIEYTLRKRTFHVAWGSFSRRYIPAMVLWSVFPMSLLKRIQVKAMKGNTNDGLPYLVCLLSSYNLNKETYPQTWFAEGIEMQFEDVKFTMPKEYDKYLTQLFGDYMKLPPVEKRKGHNISPDVDVIV